MKLLALWKFNLIPNPSPCRRRELKALSRKERVGRSAAAVRLNFASKIIKYQKITP
jgi:hypothetical protein